MGSFRFRRTVKIAPGIRLNINKKSIGLSAGVPGARISKNSDGRSTRSVGVPGTGLYWCEQKGPNAAQTAAAPAGQHAAEHPPQETGTPQSYSAAALTLHAGDTLSIVGEKYRQDVLEQVARTATGPEPYLPELKGRAFAVGEEKGRLWFRAAILREPDNEYDKNAVAVHAAGCGLVGYLDRQTALGYRPVFDELERQGCSVGACPAVLVGGDAWGVLLCLSPPEIVISDLRESQHAE